MLMWLNIITKTV